MSQLILLLFCLCVTFVGSQPAKGEAGKLFGCQYTNTAKFSTESNEVHFGDPMTAQMEFKSEDDFTKLLTAIDKAKEEVWTSYSYNNLDPFQKFYDAYKASKQTTMFDAFFNQYEIETFGSDPPPMDNSLFSLIHVYLKLETEFPEIGAHFTVATVDSDITTSTVLADAHQDDYSERPPDSFEHDYAIGLIDINVPELGGAGHVIIDTENFVTPSAVLMEDTEKDKEVKDLTASKSFGLDVHYTQLKTHLKGNYLRIDFKVADEAAKTSKLLQSDMAYIRRSLCPFIQVIGKRNLLNPQPRIVKANGKGEVEYLVYTTLRVKAAGVAEPEVKMIYGGIGDKEVARTFYMDYHPYEETELSHLRSMSKNARWTIYPDEKDLENRLFNLFRIWKEDNTFIKLLYSYDPSQKSDIKYKDTLTDHWWSNAEKIYYKGKDTSQNGSFDPWDTPISKSPADKNDLAAVLSAAA